MPLIGALAAPLHHLPHGHRQTLLPKFALPQSQHSNLQSPLSPNCTLLQLLLSRLRPPITSFSMFRNALRQSTRAVGAVSAAGRVAAVSPPSAIPATRRAIEARRKNSLNPSKKILKSANWVTKRRPLWIEKLFRAILLLRWSLRGPPSWSLRLTCFFCPGPKCRTRRRQCCLDAGPYLRRRQGFAD